MNERKNPLCVISIETYGDYAVHDIQTNSAWTENPYNDYAVVPDDMVEDIMNTRGFCDIVLNDEGSEVISFIAREIPEPKPIESEPTAEDDIDAMLVDHEYRLTLLELGVNE